MRNLLRTFFYSIPANLRFLVRRIYYLPIDSFEYITNQRRPPFPPKGLIYTGSGNFKAQGKNLLAEFIKYGHLQPSDRVLDIGSGIGRLAIPLTRYLDENGSYEGFDVVEYGVKWCKKYVSTKHPNFNFKYIPLHNDLYTKKGQAANVFKFPYDNDSFDKVILLSVFTHMLPKEVENYIREIKRVLKKEGTCYATFFIMNEESKQLMTEDFQFSYEEKNHFLMNEQVKSANVAFKETYLKAFIKKEKLVIDDIFYGWWCGRERADSVQFQDVVVFRKG